MSCDRPAGSGHDLQQFLEAFEDQPHGKLVLQNWEEIVELAKATEGIVRINNGSLDGAIHQRSVRAKDSKELNG